MLRAEPMSVRSGDAVDTRTTMDATSSASSSTATRRASIRTDASMVAGPPVVSMMSGTPNTLPSLRSTHSVA